VLEGDFDFKVARQDYYLSKQERMVQHLILQQARHKFLLSAMDKESTMLDKLRDGLTATLQDMSEFREEVEERQDELETLGKLQTADQRQTLDSRDSFVLRLNTMLGEFAYAPNNFRLSELASEVVANMQSATAKHQDGQQQLRQEQAQVVERLVELVEGMEKIVFAGKSVAVNTPPEFESKLQVLTGRKDQLRHEVGTLETDVESTYENFQLLPENRQYERQLFVDFFTDPAHMKEKFEEQQQRVEAHDIMQR